MSVGGSSAPSLDVKIMSAKPSSSSAARQSGRSILSSVKSAIHTSYCAYRGFPSKLHHELPSWVEDGALFHIRIALDRNSAQRPLTEPSLAESILESAKFYDRKQRWFITRFLLMPDHLHTLVSFSHDQAMSRVIGDWKHFQAHKHPIEWQAAISIIGHVMTNVTSSSQPR